MVNGDVKKMKENKNLEKSLQRLNFMKSLQYFYFILCFNLG